MSEIADALVRLQLGTQTVSDRIRIADTIRDQEQEIADLWTAIYRLSDAQNTIDELFAKYGHGAKSDDEARRGGERT